MMIRVVFFIFLVQLLLPKFGYAQIAAEPQAATGDNSGWKLPPLQMLIDSALIHSPLVKLAETNVQMSRYELTDIHRDWLQKLNLSADTRLGSMLDYARMSNAGSGAFIPPGGATWNYGLGLSAYMPLSDIFDRKRKLLKAQLKVEQTEIQKGEAALGVKQLVIAAYYDLLSIQKNIDVRTELLSSANILHEQSKLDYAQNKIGLADYTKAYETYLLAQNDLEAQKYNLLKSVHLLEEIIGIKLL